MLPNVKTYTCTIHPPSFERFFFTCTVGVQYYLKNDFADDDDDDDDTISTWR